MLPVFRVTCRATGASEEVTDLGRAMITGKLRRPGQDEGADAAGSVGARAVLPQRRGRLASTR